MMKTRKQVWVRQDAVEEFRCDVMQAAVIQAEGVSKEGRSATVAVVHGAPARFVVWDWSRDQVIENLFVLAGGKLPKRVSVLDSHSTYSIKEVRGSALDWVVSGNRVLATLKFAEDTESEAAWLKVRDGHVTAVSIGAMITKFSYVEPGETLDIGGVSYTAGKVPLRVNLEWEPKEVSLVVFGADPRAGVLGKHGRGKEFNHGGTGEQPGTAGNMEGWKAGNSGVYEGSVAGGAGLGVSRGNSIRSVAMNWLKRVLVQMGLVQADADDAAVEQARAALSAEQLQAVNAAVAVAQAAVVPGGEGAAPVALVTQYALESVPAVAPVAQNVVDLDAVRREGMVAEQGRQREIREACESAGLDASVAQAAIDEGLTVSQAQTRILATLRASRAPVTVGNFNINTGAGRSGMNAVTMAAGLQLALGSEWIDPSASKAEQAEQARLLEQGYGLRNMGLLDFARQSVLLDGGHPEVGKTALVQQSFSGASFSNALSSAVGRVIMANFESVYDSTAGVFYEEDLPDYKLVDRIVLTADEQLDVLPSGGTANHASGSDAKEQYQVTRFAKQFCVDEMTVVNDDLGLMLRKAENIAMAAARTKPDFVYAVLNGNPTMRDSVALFHSDHANTTTGALAAATLKTAFAKMTKQYETAGSQKVPLNLRPKWLLVPSDLELTALEILTSMGRGATDGNGDRNVLSQLGLQVRADDRLGANGALNPITKTVAVGTATNYYLAADKAYPTISIGYLKGMNRRPSIRRYTLDRGQYGLGLDVQHVVGVKAMSWQGLVKSTGA